MVMGTQAPSVYQQVIEKTKGIMSRTQELARNIEKKLNVDKLGYDGVRTIEWCFHVKLLYFAVQGVSNFGVCRRNPSV